jgi:ATP-dependent helicase/nuclease subunit A
VSEKPKTPTKEQRQAADPQRSVWVAASAGSGKTQVLVDRVIRLLLSGADPQSILCLTYTKAAAAEMANRLFQRLSTWVGMKDEDLDGEILRLSGHVASALVRALARTLFARALETPGGLKIQTIHGFCERLLQLFPLESAMAPGFRVLDDKDSQHLFREALLASLTEDHTAWAFLDHSGIRTLEDLETLTKSLLSGNTGMRQRLSDINAVADIEDLLRSVLGIITVETQHDIISVLSDIDEDAYQKAIDALALFGTHNRLNTGEVLRGVLQSSSPSERFESLSTLALTKEAKPRAGLISVAAAKAHPVVAEWLTQEQRRILDLLDRLAAQQTLEANHALYLAMVRVLARVNTAKRAKGLYDFDDLIAKTAELLNGHEAAQWVLYKLDKGLTHILVDEAQDTSPAQWTIIKALAGAFFDGEQRPLPRTVFAVGDIKQSIFSFQGADITSFEAAREEFMAALTAVDDKLDVVDLSISYRSSQVVLNGVDRAFAPGSFARSGFGARADLERTHEAFHKNRFGMVEIWDVIISDGKDEPDNWQAPVDKPSTTHHRLKLADEIATSIKSWISTRKLSGHDRTIKAGDILILLQRRSTLFNALIGALRRHGIPVAGADRLVLQASLIVKDLQALGQFIRMPDDDHALACFLKSPLAANPLDEEQLFQLAYDRGATSLWQRLAKNDPNRVMLDHCLNSMTTPFLLFARVLQRAKLKILERLGSEAEDAAQEFLNLALEYEQQSGTSLSGFLDWLSEGETEIKREMDQDGDQVRIMTVHGAKGLEAPIVILADATDPPSSKSKRFVPAAGAGPTKGLQIFKPETLVKPAIINALSDVEKTLQVQEKMRLMYVAMTRAADELYICGSHDTGKLNDMSWYVNIRDALLKDNNLREITTDPCLKKWRMGAEPEGQSATQPEAQAPAAIPQWARQPVVSTPKPLPPLAASRNSDQFDRAAIQQGIAIHRLIELMADAPTAERLKVAERWAQKLHLPIAIAHHLDSALNEPTLQPLFGPDGQSEVTVHGEVAGLGVIHGRIDRLAVSPKELILLDYKTNRQPPQDLKIDHPYTQQMAKYAALMAQVYPGHLVKAGVLWTQTGQVYWLAPLLLSQSLDHQIQALTGAPFVTTS